MLFVDLADFDLAWRLAFLFAAATASDETDAGRSAMTLSFRISHEYGDGVAGIIVSQMIDSETRTCEPGTSEEE